MEEEAAAAAAAAVAAEACGGRWRENRLTIIRESQ
jgi:hypothetical protein